MAGPYNSQYQQNLENMPPIQTQNHHQQQRPQQHPQQHQLQHPQQHPQQQVPLPFSPPSYQQSPGPMSPNMGGMGAIPPAKRMRVSPNPTSPYTSPFSGSPYPPVPSPYGANSPPGSQYLSLPQSPAGGYPSQSFHQPQPYQHTNEINSRPPQGSMPPPKVPASKAQDGGELEKANARDMDVNNISDVLTGSGIDLRAEEEYLTHSFGNRNLGNSFNSQASSSTISPHGSFNQWSQVSGHGAFQGTGPLSQQPISQEQQEAELLRRHEQAARVFADSAQSPLTDPFLVAGTLRQRLATTAYQNGIQVNLEGLFDRIPETPQNVRRTSLHGANGESIVALQADSLLNHNAPFVEILSLISLAAEDRMRTLLEDAFALSQTRQKTSHGVVPPNLADLALANGNTRPATAVPTNISKTAWEAPDSAVSPMTVRGKNQMDTARLPTPPTEAPPTPQPTVAFTSPIAGALKRRVDGDFDFEKARIAKRQKRLQGAAGTAAEIPAVVPLIPEKMSKKERDRLNKIGQTDEVLHRKANETASMALGGKKKYSWMTGGGGGGGFGSGASTPRLNTNVGSSSGTATPAQPQIDRGLQGSRRTYGSDLESGELGRRVQLRDLILVLEIDGKQKRHLVGLLSKMRGADRDSEKPVTTAAR